MIKLSLSLLISKAYDSVPRDGLWIVLAQLGVPSKLVNLIRSFHTTMSARLRLDGDLLDLIAVNNGLRQGCTMAPVLFNLYMCAVVEVWQARLCEVDDVGICINYQCDGQLFRKPRRRMLHARITEGQFADDSVLFATTHSVMVLAITTSCDVAADFGLTVSCPKTKFMVAGVDVCDEDVAPIIVGDASISHVPDFRYLPLLIDKSGRSSRDIGARISAASRAFGALRRPVFLKAHLSITTNVWFSTPVLCLFYCMVLSAGCLWNRIFAVCPPPTWPAFDPFLEYPSEMSCAPTSPMSKSFPAGGMPAQCLLFFCTDGLSGWGM